MGHVPSLSAPVQACSVMERGTAIREAVPKTVEQTGREESHPEPSSFRRSTQALQEQVTQMPPSLRGVRGTRSMATGSGKQGVERQSGHSVALCLVVHVDRTQREGTSQTAFFSSRNKKRQCSTETNTTVGLRQKPRRRGLELSRLTRARKWTSCGVTELLKPLVVGNS